MADEKVRFEIDLELMDTGKNIIEALAGIKPFSSLSFTLNEEGTAAVNDILKIIEWGIGKNKAKIKEAALRVITPISDVEPGTPLNVNLDEAEIKAMGEIIAQIERALSKQKDGVLTR